MNKVDEEDFYINFKNLSHCLNKSGKRKLTNDKKNSVFLNNWKKVINFENDLFFIENFTFFQNLHSIHLLLDTIDYTEFDLNLAKDNNKIISFKLQIDDTLNNIKICLNHNLIDINCFLNLNVIEENKFKCEINFEIFLIKKWLGLENELISKLLINIIEPKILSKNTNLLNNGLITPKKYNLNPHFTQAKGLNPTLLPYQQRAVSWMLEKEGMKFEETGAVVPMNSLEEPDLPFFFERHSTEDGECLYFNRLTGYVSEKLPKNAKRSNGGILAEEMGLGKTIELLALILLNKKEGLEITQQPSTFKSEVCLYCNQDDDGNIKKWKSKDTIFNVARINSILKCEECNGQFHLRCSDFKLKNNFLKSTSIFSCKFCREKSKNDEIFDSKSTLIIAPLTIINQWKGEILTHTQLTVFVWTGDIYEQQLLTPKILGSFDVVLVPYNAFKGEIHAAKPISDRRLRKNSKFPRRIKWWRLCFDEAQELESSKATAELAEIIPAKYRWAVSGTPFGRNGLEDVKGLMDFLLLDPLPWSKLTKCLEKYPEIFNPLFFEILRSFLHRNNKKSVENELILPLQTQTTYSLQFTKAEMHFYTLIKHECQKELSELGCNNFDDLEGFSLEKRKEILSVMRLWIRRLRHACCHPQVGSYNKNELRKTFKSISEVLATMISQGKSMIVNLKRNEFILLISKAQTFEFDKDFATAINIYQNLVLKCEKQILEFTEEIVEAKKQKINLQNLLKEANDKNEELRTLIHQRKNSLLDAVDNNDSDILKYEKNLAYIVELEKALHNLTSREVTLINNERNWKEVLHKLFFFLGAAFHFLEEKKNEDKYYELAEKLRLDILFPTITKVQSSIKSLKLYVNKVNVQIFDVPESLKKNKNSFTEAKNYGGMYISNFSNFKGGIKSGIIFEEIAEIIEMLDLQWDVMNKFRDDIIRILVTEIEPDKETVTGEEYDQGLEHQRLVEVYQDVYSSSLVQRFKLLTGEIIPKTSKIFELKEERKMFDLLKPFNSFKNLRNLINQLKQISLLEVGKLPKVEIEMCAMASTEFKKELDKQLKKYEILDRENQYFNSTFNIRVNYFKNLQTLSDGVMEVEVPPLEKRDSRKNEIQKELNDLNIDMNGQIGHLRYLETLLNEEKERENGTRISSDASSIQNCQICKSLIDECITPWILKKRKCPLCRQPCKIDDMQEVNFNELVKNVEVKEVNYEESKGCEKSELKKKIGGNLLTEEGNLNLLITKISEVKIKGSFGTKLDFLLKHLLFLINSENFLESADVGVKILVFSQFTEVLDIIAIGLSENKIHFVRLDGNKKEKKTAIARKKGQGGRKRKKMNQNVIPLEEILNFLSQPNVNNFKNDVAGDFSDNIKKKKKKISNEQDESEEDEQELNGPTTNLGSKKMEILIEIEGFCLEFGRISEASDLFRIVKKEFYNVDYNK
ncbi:hypothetical protein HK099_008059 [Clydaea vesicula]|uniref:PHD-type domain-containing protein n=1 Tax=Clydaea vesicula TaxID=447962 RepID=A0AAD5TWA0_9FUNG|nr:hypothetical protein HK099_008059 [Clydaea vesicula]